MTQKNRITYRFDRNGQSINEENSPNDNLQEAVNNYRQQPNVIPLYPSLEQHAMSEANPWNNSLQEDIGALEQMIRNSNTKPASVETVQRIPNKLNSSRKKQLVREIPKKLNNIQTEVAKSNFHTDQRKDPMLAYEDEYVEDEMSRKRMQYTKIKRKAGTPSWFNVFMSVTAALATGALFGYLLLSLFTGASIWPAGLGGKSISTSISGEPSNDNAAKGSTTNENVNKVSQGTNPEKESNLVVKPDANMAMSTINGLDRSYYLLQFGVFSNSEGRDAAMAQLNEKGLAGASMKTAADYRVYAGISGDRSEAQTIKAMLPDIELYIKEVNIVNPGKIPFTGSQKAVQSFFDQTGLLVQMLDELTIAQLEQPSLSPLGSAAAVSWQNEHKKWTENAAELRIGIVDEQGKNYLELMTKAMNAAANSMVQYDKKPSQAQLWSTQEEIMNVILTQKEWFEKISAL